ncbi:phosphatidylinositol 3-kinase regulatory subunit alpha-like [Morphnus guianensis]
MASSDGLQYRALYEYQKDREEDLALCPGDVLTVSRAGLLSSPDYKDGDERSPQGWLHGLNERTKERGDFPGTYVEYLGPARIVTAATKARPRPLPPPPAGTPTSWGLPGQAELAEHPTLPEQALPTVARLIEALEKQGLDSEVLYRSTPSALGDAELKQALLADASSVDMDLYDAQTLAEALKWYLQELPSPLVPPALYSDLVHMAQETPGLEECGQRARALLAPPALPQPQALLLRQLVHHFCHLCQGTRRSRLSPRLLGELFGELLLCPATASTEASPELRARILESLIVAGDVAEVPAAPDFMCAESHCVHRRPAASPVGHPQDGDEDGCSSPTSPCVGKELGACVFLQMLLTPPSLDPPRLQFCPFYCQHQRLPPAPLCSLLLLWWLKSQPSASHLLLPCPSCLVASHVPSLSKTETHAPCALCSTSRMGGKRSIQAGIYTGGREGAQWSTSHRP